MVLTIVCLTARCDYYEVRISDIGWTTGFRENINTSLDMSGSAIGEGTYQRYTDMKFNDVRMCERIAADNGTLDTSERVRLIAQVAAPIEVTLDKFSGSQDYVLTVNETWPVYMAARRSVDYVGKSISNRDFLGNNLDFVSASYFEAKDLRMDRSAFLDLRKVWFEVAANDSTKMIYYDRFLPAKSLDYNLRSLSKGTATLRYRQTEDHSVANEGFESYTGDFLINRHISMHSSGRNIAQVEQDWLCGGCPFEFPVEILYNLEGQVFDAETYGGY